MHLGDPGLTASIASGSEDLVKVGSFKQDSWILGLTAFFMLLMATQDLFCVYSDPQPPARHSAGFSFNPPPF